MHVRPPTQVRILLAALSLIAAGPLLAAGSADEATAPATRSSGLDTGSIDPKVRPQDDFFRHVNSGWLRTHEIPADRAGWGGFSEVDDVTRARVREVVEATLKDSTRRRGSEAQKIADLYAGFLDESRLDALGLEPLEAEFAR